jgi:hypothetical protein
VSVYVMKRVLAHFALFAILGPFVLPLALALRSSETPACCLPGGKHHCTQKPNGTGFKSKTDACPYASQFPATGLTGLHFAKFDLAEPVVGGFFYSTLASAGHRIATRQLSDRGPPVLSR